MARLWLLLESSGSPAQQQAQNAGAGLENDQRRDRSHTA
jgi:hypothetical protein